MLPQVQWAMHILSTRFANKLLTNFSASNCCFVCMHVCISTGNMLLEVRQNACMLAAWLAKKKYLYNVLYITFDQYCREDNTDSTITYFWSTFTYQRNNYWSWLVSSLQERNVISFILHTINVTVTYRDAGTLPCDTDSLLFNSQQIFGSAVSIIHWAMSTTCFRKLSLIMAQCALCRVTQ